MSDEGAPGGRSVTFTASDIRFLTSPSEVPTHFVTGIKGVMVLNHTATVSFYEQTMGPDDTILFGRHVVSLAIPNDQFCAAVDLLAKIAKEIREEGKE